MVCRDLSAIEWPSFLGITRALKTLWPSERRGTAIATSSRVGDKESVAKIDKRNHKIGYREMTVG
jgi:hypothetical protein